ncbi:hypothetical protein CFI10_07035 [Marinobacterium iners]|nr:hypothetical protein CFI10_07035 [Marinobacterium iners]
MRQQLLRVAAWASQTVNLWLLFGHHDQTVSARCYLNRDQPGWRLAYLTINRIFFWQKDHCRSSHLRDVEFALDVLVNETRFRILE